MGRFSKWLRSILGLKKSDSHHQLPSSPSSKAPHEEKCCWIFLKSYRDKESAVPDTTDYSAGSNSIAESPLHCRRQQGYDDSVSVVDNAISEVVDIEHAVALAVASAVAAQAAMLAAQAAATVVRLSSDPATHVGASRGARQELNRQTSSTARGNNGGVIRLRKQRPIGN